MATNYSISDKKAALPHHQPPSDQMPTPARIMEIGNAPGIAIIQNRTAGERRLNGIIGLHKMIIETDSAEDG